MSRYHAAYSAECGCGPGHQVNTIKPAIHKIAGFFICASPRHNLSQVLEFSIQKIRERPLRIRGRASGGSCGTRCQGSERQPDSGAGETD